MPAAERVLLPQVRAAPEETAILANGFSCRERIGKAPPVQCCSSPN